MMLSRLGPPLAIAVAFGSAARAADWYTGAPVVEVVTPAPTISIDASLDVTSRSSLAGALIGKIAPFGSLAESGARVRASVVIGTYAYNASDLLAFAPIDGQFIPTTSGYGRVRGTLEDGSFMAGYEVVTPTASFAAYLGPDIMNHSLSVFDPGNQVRGTQAGVKVGLEAFVTPTASTMISGLAYYSSNHNSYYSRLKLGVALVDYIYAGPEALALGDDYFTQWRVGGHLSGLQFGLLQVGVSGGYLHDRVRGGGGYGILDTHLAF